MGTNTSTEQKDNRGSDKKNLILRVSVQVCVLLPILIALLFIPAGTLDWLMGWVLLGIYLTSLFISTLLVILRAPGLAKERSDVPESAEKWDKRLINLYNVLVYLVMMPLAGFDERYQWSPEVDLWLQCLGMVVVVLGSGLFVWAMMTNRFFSAVVRIQEERGHTVVGEGPYKYVRHPGYVGMIAMFLGTPLMLGSLWALIPATGAVIVVVVRTKLEDRVLIDRLDGYQDYTRHVQYRLLPGIW